MSNIHHINNLQGLSFLIQVPVPLLKEHIRNPHYREFTIPKKSGGHRQIMAPADGLKYIQSKLAYEFQKKFKAPDYVFGFVKNQNGIEKSIRENALLHVGKKYVWNIDIKDFFGSISTQKIKDILMLEPFQMKEQLAIDLALLLCYQRQLPAGAPSSPILSNIACRKMDIELTEFIFKQGSDFELSRYADDLTISSNQEITESFQKQVYKILKQNGFEINKKKNRIYTECQAQWVTGIKVNAKLNLDRKYIKNIRAIIHDIESRGINKALNRMNEINPEIYTIKRFIHHLKGRINHVGFVKGKEDPSFQNLMSRLEVIKSKVKV
jgi:RNA-directed DNA polymerase